jgi:hypothetical protein
MDTTKFLKLLKQAVREVVKEEISTALRKELSVLREHVVQPSSQTTSYTVNKKPKLHNNVVKKNYTKNSLLNDLLNESTPFGADSYTQDTFTFSSNDINNFGMSRQPALQDTEGNIVPINNEATEAVANAVTRDYRDLMKAINSKKGK